MEAVHSGSFDTEKTSMDSALSLMTRTNRAIGWLKKNREGSPLAVAWIQTCIVYVYIYISYDMSIYIYIHTFTHIMYICFYIYIRILYYSVIFLL